MKAQTTSVYFFLLIFFLSTRLAAQDIPVDSVIKISCSSDAAQTYSLYLPKGFTTTKKYPVLLFLDPGGRGEVPVIRYRSVADKYGIILTCSYNSRNFDAASSVNAIEAIHKDLLERFPVGISKTWLAGFSGGARMASFYAETHDRIDGVIACGAAFAGERSTAYARKIPFAWIVGIADMNFEEMLQANETLDQADQSSLLLLFNGGHSWPPVEQLSIAAYWLSGEESLLPGQPAIDEQLQKMIRDEKVMYHAWLEANEYKQLNGFEKTADSLRQQIESAKGFKQSRRSFSESMEEERKYMDEFSLLFSQSVAVNDISISNDDTWKAMSSKLNRNSSNEYYQLSGERKFDFSWRLCSENYFQFMEIRQYGQAYKTAYILSFFQPAHLNSYYLMARAAAGLMDRSLCLKNLKQAIRKGGITKEKINGDAFITKLLDAETIDRLFS